MKKALLVVFAVAVASSLFAGPRKRCPYIGAVSADVSGRVLFSDCADEPAYPASVTKLMTALLVLEDVKAGRYVLSDEVEATAEIYRRCEPSWIGIKPGECMTVRDLLLALMVESANDAAIVLAVRSAGSTDAFVERMNARAAELGMSRTRYFNPNGLPPNKARRYPWKENNVSTAADQLKLAVVLLKHTEILEFTRVKDCDLVKTPRGYRISVCRAVGRPSAATSLADGEKIVKHLANHNNVMVQDRLKIYNPDGGEAVDGLKTGFIEVGGSSVVMTASRNGKRVIVVVLGSDKQLDRNGKQIDKGSRVRDENAKRLVMDALGAVDF